MIMNKTQTILTLAVGAIVVAAAMVSADSLDVKAYVPFEFVAANQTFEPGEYTFGVDDETDNPGALAVYSVGGHQTKVMLTEPNDTAGPMDESEVHFDNFHGKYYLAEVWIAGLDEGRRVAKSEIHDEEARIRSAIRIRAN